MKKVFGIIIDIIATLFVATITAALMCIAYTVILPIGAIFDSLVNGQKLSESWLELNKELISRMNEL